VLCVVYGSVGQLPVTDLFAGCLVPGLLMLGLFMGYIWLRCRLDPAAGPAAPPDEIPREGRLRLVLLGLAPPALLIAAVLGSILAGVASPTEAGAVGAAGVILLAAANGRLRPGGLVEAGRITLRVTSFVMFVVLGGMMFSAVFYVHGGRGLVQAALTAFPLGPAGVVALMLGIVFAMGFVLDWATIVLVTVPLFAPVIRDLGVDPLWFAVMMIVTLQTSYLTPPMAPAIFYLRSIAPPEITYAHMARGVVPFIACQLLTMALVAAFPATATWLPRWLGG
jgi:tripartite ATP-independent transporter DctM subunit